MPKITSLSSSLREKGIPKLLPNLYVNGALFEEHISEENLALFFVTKLGKIVQCIRTTSSIYITLKR